MEKSTERKGDANSQLEGTRGEFRRSAAEGGGYGCDLWGVAARLWWDWARLHSQLHQLVGKSVERGPIEGSIDWVGKDQSRKLGWWWMEGMFGFCMK